MKFREYILENFDDARETINYYQLYHLWETTLFLFLFIPSNSK